MRDDAAQSDLFEPAKPMPGLGRPMHPPFSPGEFAALEATLRGMDRIPEDWRPGWHQMTERAGDTIRRLPREQRGAAHGKFFAEVQRLLKIDYLEAHHAELAAAAAALETSQPVKRARRG